MAKKRARKRTSKKTSKKRKSAKKRSKKNQIPLPVLERRLHKLARIVASRSK